MRRALIVTAMAATFLTALAAPALAQRDPFEPLVSEGGTAGVVSTDTGIIEGPAVQPVAPSTPEGLADTGAPVDVFVALAYGLLVAGGAAVALARTWSPAPGARRRTAR